MDVANSKGREKLMSILSKEQYALYLKLREDTRKQKEDSLKKNPNYKLTDQDVELDF